MRSVSAPAGNRARAVLPDGALYRVVRELGRPGPGPMQGRRAGFKEPLGAFQGELCPANVVVGKDGVARIVAVFRPRPVKMTSASEALGYAPPEVHDGRSVQDARVDIYATGV